MVVEILRDKQLECDLFSQYTMGGFWGDFTIIFWVVEYIQRPIYIWNKISKHIMSQCGIYFQSTLHIAYNSQHFGQIEYVNGILSLHLFFKQMIPKFT